MRVLAAYLGVVLLWSTTPLAIKWSGEGPGFLFGAAARMSIGLIFVLLILAARRQILPLHRRAWRSYLAASIHIYASMLVLYWAAQFIPSGWISVIFGLTPMLTALLAAIWLQERSLRLGRLLSYGLGLAGLAVIFGSALDYSQTALHGVVGVLASSFLQAASSVWVKRTHAGLPALVQVGGGLLASVPAYWLSWVLFDGCWPQSLPITSLASIAYLGAIATPLGFSLYFYLLKNLAATQVSLITLITPVTALLLGAYANHEPISPRFLLGAALILFAVAIHEFRFPKMVPQPE